MIPLNELVEKLNVLFRKAGDEKPEHKRLGFDNAGFNKLWCRDQGDWLMHESDVLDLLASHYERKWYALKGGLYFTNGDEWCCGWRDAATVYDKRHTDKLYAIYLAMDAKYGGDNG